MARDIATGTDREIPASAFGLPKGGASTLALSPDGRTLAFWRKDAESSKTYLSTVGVDGANLRDLYTFDLDFNTAVSYLVWRRDGQSILFAQLRESKQHVMRISAGGGKAEFTGVETGAGVANRPFVFDLSPDGSRIAFCHTDAPSTNDSPVGLWVTDNILNKVK